jgi:hypothetical protein
LSPTPPTALRTASTPEPLPCDPFELDLLRGLLLRLLVFGFADLAFVDFRFADDFGFDFVLAFDALAPLLDEAGLADFDFELFDWLLV